ncbi:MAG TPA: hypothetical protein VHD56_08735 [Tepidisphaeraceae bacterium]|nr:hypothetical protein [Tepidisphaeraceae bacterium]
MTDTTSAESESTGLPVLGSWRAVYFLVAAIVTTYIVLLALLTRLYQ